MNKVIERIIETVQYNLGTIPEKEHYVDDHIEAGNIGVVRKLIRDNPDLIHWRDSFGNSLLHIAVQEKQVQLTNFRIEAGCNVNARDNAGETPLHVAGFFPSKEIAAILLKNGADPTIADNDGVTPSAIASE